MRTTINICGDFNIRETGRLEVEERLKDVLEEAAVNVVNFEAPVRAEGATAIGKVGPLLSQDEKAPAFLEGLGFNMVTLANNHIMDYGAESLQKTRQLFKKSIVVGAGTPEEAYQVKTIEVGGLRIGFLGLTQREFGVIDLFNTNDRELKNNCVGAAWMCHPSVMRIIHEAKKTSDYLFVLPHAGIEHQRCPLPELRQLYREYIEMGADGVFASHPHTPQGFEYYNDKPICYSLGNFCCDNVMPVEPEMYWYGMMARLTIDNGRLAMDVLYTHYQQEQHLLSLTTNNTITRFMEGANGILHDDDAYRQEVDDLCLRLLHGYDMSFARSGYFPYGTMRFLKQLVRHIIGRQDKPNPRYLLHLMRCESHRWAIQRALNNKSL